MRRVLIDGFAILLSRGGHRDSAGRANRWGRGPRAASHCRCLLACSAHAKTREINSKLYSEEQLACGCFFCAAQFLNGRPASAALIAWKRRGRELILNAR